jgi:hypothetical protein
MGERGEPMETETVLYRRVLQPVSWMGVEVLSSVQGSRICSGEHRCY